MVDNCGTESDDLNLYLRACGALIRIYTSRNSLTEQPHSLLRIRTVRKQFIQPQALTPAVAAMTGTTMNGKGIALSGHTIASPKARTYDIAIIGAGIIGTALAHTLGTQGRSVLLLERDLSEPDRIVGELLQPGGVKMLTQLGLSGEPPSPSPRHYI